MQGVQGVVLLGQNERNFCYLKGQAFRKENHYGSKVEKYIGKIF